MHPKSESSRDALQRAMLRDAYQSGYQDGLRDRRPLPVPRRDDWRTAGWATKVTLAAWAPWIVAVFVLVLIAAQVAARW